MQSTFFAVADIQYADIPDGFNMSRTERRSNRGSLIGLEKMCNNIKNSVDFILNLGDIVDGKECRQENFNVKNHIYPKASIYLNRIRNVVPKDLPILEVVGNHECYNFSRKVLPWVLLPPSPGIKNLLSPEKNSELKMENILFENNDFSDLDMKSCMNTSDTENCIESKNINDDLNILNKSWNTILNSNQSWHQENSYKNMNIRFASETFPELSEVHAYSTLLSGGKQQWVLLVVDDYDISYCGSIFNTPKYQEATSLLKKYNPHVFDPNVSWVQKSLLNPKYPYIIPYNGAVSKLQFEWIKLELQKARDNNQLVIIAAHTARAIYCYGKSARLWNSKIFLDLMWEYSDVIQLFLSGHGHSFQLTRGYLNNMKPQYKKYAITGKRTAHMNLIRKKNQFVDKRTIYFLQMSTPLTSPASIQYQAGAIFTLKERNIHIQGIGNMPCINFVDLPDIQNNVSHYQLVRRGTSSNPYTVLGLNRDATYANIKIRFRELAKLHHPDINKNPAAIERMREITEAYEKISKNAQFNVDPKEDPFSTETQERYSKTSNNSYSADAEAFQAAFRAASARIISAPGEDAVGDVTLTFNEAFRGCKKVVDIELDIRCNSCFGTGELNGASYKTCPRCEGSCVTTIKRGNSNVTVPCFTCNGSGIETEKKCIVCNGKGITKSKKSVTIVIPPAIQNQDEIRVRGGGHAGVRGGRPGSLFLRVTVKPDNHFKLIGKDLHSSIKIPLGVGILGGNISVPTPDGDKNVTLLKNTFGQKHFIVIPNLGAPSADGTYGNMIVKLYPDIPKKLSARQINLLKEFDILTQNN